MIETMTSYDTGSTLNHFNFSNIYIQQFPDKMDSIISQKTETLAYESQHKIIKLRFHCFKRRLDLAAYKHFNATRIMEMELEGIYCLAYFSATLLLWKQTKPH